MLNFKDFKEKLIFLIRRCFTIDLILNYQIIIGLELKDVKKTFTITSVVKKY